MHMPLPATEADMPETLTEIANETERTYITNDHWYRIQEPWWVAAPDISEPELAPEASDG